ncbi:MAG: hypothetical protein HC846_14455 [Blastocatellia bacterium]|nr:hypothetical protein [Blastocatellia bacterium]
MLTESDKIVAEAISKPLSTNILTQNTEVFADSAKSNQTLQSGVKTDILPVENSAAFPPQTEAGQIHLSEAETSVKTKMEAERQNIQIPIQPNTVTNIAENTQSGGSKRGMAIGAAAFGGLLLVGSALGGLYVVNQMYLAVIRQIQMLRPKKTQAEAKLRLIRFLPVRQTQILLIQTLLQMQTRLS